MMRYAKISAEGEYMPPPPANAKAAYATMVYVRATIVEDAGWVLARATTIAVCTLSSNMCCASGSGCKAMCIDEIAKSSHLNCPCTDVTGEAVS